MIASWRGLLSFCYVDFGFVCTIQPTGSERSFSAMLSISESRTQLVPLGSGSSLFPINSLSISPENITIPTMGRICIVSPIICITE